MSMRKANVEIGVGIFVLVGIACLAYLAVQLGSLEMFKRGYRVYAVFNNISGIKVGAPVEVAGVEVGRVHNIRVTPDARAELTLSLREDVVLKEDTIASIRTMGVIGDKFVKLTPGYGEETIPPEGRIRDTESAIEIEELLAKFIHGQF